MALAHGFNVPMSQSMIRQPPKTTAVRRVAIAALDCRRILEEQSGLIDALVARRHKVTCIASAPSRSQVEALEALGASVVDAPLEDAGAGFLRGLSARRQVALRFVAADPHVVVLLDSRSLSAAGASLGRHAGVRVVAVLPGLPLSDDAIERSLVKAAPVISALVLPREYDLRRAREDLALPADCLLLPSRGSGLDVIVRPVPVPALSGPPSLLAWVESRDAALAGVLQSAVQSLPENTLRLVLAGPGARSVLDGGKAGEALPPHVEIREALRAVHAVAVPTAQAGVPFGLRAALAAGRAVLTTNVAGARDAVDQGVNGVVAGGLDVASLAKAMADIAGRPELLASMGRASRTKAERLYDEARIVPQLFQAMALPTVNAGWSEERRRTA